LEENNRLTDLEPFCLTGELALSGQLRPVKGVLSIALEAKRRWWSFDLILIRSQ
jgi:predicted ATPase with chaperone activity